MPEGAIFVKESPIQGKGVFVGRRFSPGEEVDEFKGQIVSWDNFPMDLQDGPSLQVGYDTYMMESGEANDFINHSCDPSCAVFVKDGRVFLKAIRPIEPGDEITFDYSLTIIDDPWAMECRCGSPLCRGIVGEFRDLPEAVRRRYKEAGVVPPYVLEAENLVSRREV